MEKANTILIGGAMANTFLKAEGIRMSARAALNLTRSVSRESF